MSLVKNNSFIPFKPIGLDRFLDGFSVKKISDFDRSDFINTTPPVNMIEAEDSVTIEVAAPGLTKIFILI